MCAPNATSSCDYRLLAYTTYTLAYPTTVTDPHSQQSKLQYRHDIGAVTRTQDPKMLAADASKDIVSKYVNQGLI